MMTKQAFTDLIKNSKPGDRYEYRVKKNATEWLVVFKNKSTQHKKWYTIDLSSNDNIYRKMDTESSYSTDYLSDIIKEFTDMSFVREKIAIKQMKHKAPRTKRKKKIIKK